MKIALFLEQNNFTKTQQGRLASLGSISFATTGSEMTHDQCVELAQNADVLVLDPDNFGGFDPALPKVSKLIDVISTVKGVSLATTSFGWVDRPYLRSKGISVSNVPGYSRESVAEHTIALLLCAMKRILLTDRRTMKGQYQKVMGYELKGKTFGIIGLGNIGSRTAEIAQGLGMNVIAFNHSPKDIPGVEMKSLDDVLAQSDALAFHTTHCDENIGFIGKKELAKVKKGVFIVNTADKEVINNDAITEALQNGQVDTYICEGTLFEGTPLEGLENAIGLNGFGYYTKEALENLFEIVVDNVEAIAKGSPIHVVN